MDFLYLFLYSDGVQVSLPMPSQKKGLLNTGFLNIPLCPIYGIMGVAYCIFLPELTNKIFFLFLGGCVIAFIVIVVTGAVLEKAFNRNGGITARDVFSFKDI